MKGFSGFKSPLKQTEKKKNGEKKSKTKKRNLKRNMFNTKEEYEADKKLQNRIDKYMRETPPYIVQKAFENII
tara:strand:+ start:308 stop:526 length:219 start_codon:yes stop_codon:yes gene_type:complete